LTAGIAWAASLIPRSAMTENSLTICYPLRLSFRPTEKKWNAHRASPKPFTQVRIYGIGSINVLNPLSFAINGKT
jgi:hypothetical protein